MIVYKKCDVVALVFILLVYLLIYCNFMSMELKVLSQLKKGKETWTITVKILRKFEVCRRTPPFLPWKYSMLLLDEEVIG